MIRPLFEQNLSMSAIAKVVGTSQATISRLCKKYNLKRDPIWTIISNSELLQNTNLSTYEIAQKFGISPQSVHERQTSLGINRPLTTLIDAIADKNRKYHIDLSHFKKLDTIGSYWLGVLFADGSVYQHSGNKPHYVSVSLALKDKDWLEQYRDDIGLANTYNIQEYTDKNGFKRATVKFSNIHFARLLWTYGLDPRNNYKTTIPDTVLPSHFVRGFLDGDGCICIKKGRTLKTGGKGSGFLDISICAENYRLAQSLIKIIFKSGIVMNGPYAMGSIWTIRTSHQKALYLANWIWKNPVRMLQRKFLKYQSFIIPSSPSLPI